MPSLPPHLLHLQSSRPALPSGQPHLPGGRHLLRGLLLHRRHDRHRDYCQDPHLVEEERLQRPARRPQAGQEHPAAQTGNRK